MLDQGAGNGGDMQSYLKSFEDTIQKLEYDVDILSKDFIVVRDSFSQELQEGLQTISETRTDYIDRMNAVYLDQGKMVTMFNENNKNIQETLKQEALRASHTFKTVKSMLSDFESRLLTGQTNLDSYQSLGDQIQQ